MKRFIAVVLLLFCFNLLTTGGVAQRVSKADLPKDIELEMRNYSLYINRQAIAENVGSMGGQVLWFCAPDGRQFILSTNPHTGYDFKKAGTIIGNTISFRYDNNDYEWTSTAPIVRDGTEKELWLLVGTKYLRKDCTGSPCFGAASPFAALLRSR